MFKGTFASKTLFYKEHASIVTGFMINCGEGTWVEKFREKNKYQFALCGHNRTFLLFLHSPILRQGRETQILGTHIHIHLELVYK